MSLPGRKEPGGGEGRVQAERTTHRSPQGQGNGPEGERSTQRCRSPDPGRRCPCGCPQQVDRLGRSLARGVARLAPGWLPTIMTGAAPPCPYDDETHRERPRRRLGASRRAARDARGPCQAQARDQAPSLSRPWLLLPLPPTSRTYLCGEDCVCRQDAGAGAQSSVGERSSRVRITSPIRHRRLSTRTAPPESRRIRGQCAVARVSGRQPQTPSPTWEARNTRAPSTSNSPME